MRDVNAAAVVRGSLLREAFQWPPPIRCMHVLFGISLLSDLLHEPWVFMRVLPGTGQLTPSTGVHLGCQIDLDHVLLVKREVPEGAAQVLTGYCCENAKDPEKCWMPLDSGLLKDPRKCMVADLRKKSWWKQHKRRKWYSWLKSSCRNVNCWGLSTVPTPVVRCTRRTFTMKQSKRPLINLLLNFVQICSGYCCPEWDQSILIPWLCKVEPNMQYGL